MSKFFMTPGKVTLALTVAASLSACGAFETKKNGEKANENDSGLAGTWQGNCVKADWLGLSHQKEQLKFSAVGDFDQVTTTYSDDSCAAPQTELTEHGTYAALKASTTAPNANDINFTATEYTVTPKSDDAVKLMNTSSYCGISNWAKDQSTTVTDKTCLGKKYAKGAVIFDVYHVDGSKLTLGKGSFFTDKSDASARPTKLDDSNVYTKQ